MSQQRVATTRPGTVATTAEVDELERTGGWVLVFSAGFAFYTASAMMLENSFGRTILPLLKYKRAALVPGGRLTEPIELPRGMPGVRAGQ